MVNWIVTVGNLTLENVFDIEYNTGEEDGLGTATIICANSYNNRQIKSGEAVKITRNGSVDFRGYVVGKPTKGGADQINLEIDVVDKRSELQYLEPNRVFYQKDTGEIVKSLVNEKIKTVETDNEYGVIIDKGKIQTEGGPWSSNIPITENGDIAIISLSEVGENFIFLGWPEGSFSNPIYKLTHDSVPTKAIPGDGQIDTFYTRLVVNNKGEIFEVEIDLRDNAGNNYIWNPDISESGFKTYELKGEDASSESQMENVSKLSNDGHLQYRFKTDGVLPEARAAGVDFASTVPYQVKSRNTPIGTSEVQNTGNVISRRIQENSFKAINQLATEDKYISYIDKDDELHYEPAGERLAKRIEYSTTNVVEAKFNRDYQSITNRVTVKASGDIRVTEEEPSSINFYGISSREKPIVDKEIQTEEEARRRAKGFLDKNAWTDEAFNFVIGDQTFKNIEFGEEVFVKWPPENINGLYVVSDVKVDKDGLVYLSITNRSGI